MDTQDPSRESPLGFEAPVLHFKLWNMRIPACFLGKDLLTPHLAPPQQSVSNVDRIEYHHRGEAILDKLRPVQDSRIVTNNLGPTSFQACLSLRLDSKMPPRPTNWALWGKMIAA